MWINVKLNKLYMESLRDLSIDELVVMRDSGENVQYLIDRKIHEVDGVRGIEEIVRYVREKADRDTAVGYYIKDSNRGSDRDSNRDKKKTKK